MCTHRKCKLSDCMGGVASEEAVRKSGLFVYSERLGQKLEKLHRVQECIPFILSNSLNI